MFFLSPHIQQVCWRVFKNLNDIELYTIAFSFHCFSLGRNIKRFSMKKCETELFFYRRKKPTITMLTVPIKYMECILRFNETFIFS
jgi:hypothetical protein